MVEPLKPEDLAWVSRPYRWGAFLKKLLGRPDKVALLRRRQEVRDELRERLGLPGPAERPKAPDGPVPEVLVVKLHARRRWAYPKPDERLLQLTASSWFKYEVKNVADADLEVFVGLTNVAIKKGKARPIRGDGDLVYVVGRIPLESIRHADWSPDPTSWRPRLYTHYGWRGPSREVALFEDRDGYLFELHDIELKPERYRPLHAIRYELRRRRKIRHGD